MNEPEAGLGGGGSALVAVDVGTSGARAVAFDLKGRLLLQMRRPFGTVMSQPGWAEQDARVWRSGATSALGGLLRGLGPRWQIEAIGLTGQCPSIVPVDRRGEPLRPGIIYRDNRATPQATRMLSLFGATWLHLRTGHVPAAFHVGPKVLWIRECEPDLFKAATHFLEPSELVAREFTGELVTDWTMATATALFNLQNRAWDEEILGPLGLDPALFPVPHPSWAVVGQLRPTLVRKFGLKRSIPVVAGAADSLACALGVGIAGPGVVSEMAGSSSCLNSIVREPLTRLDVTHYPHVVPGGSYVTEVGINTSGEVIDWVAGLAYARKRHHPSGLEFAQLAAEAAKVNIGAEGLLFLPVLGDGERDDPALRGAMTGLSLRHGPPHIARAAFEGVALAIRERLSMLEVVGSQIRELRVSGGDTRLRTWTQIKADATGVRVVMIPGDATAAGVAMLAGIGGGAYADAEDAIRRAGQAGEAFEPRASAKAGYDDLYGRYLDLRQSAAARPASERSG